MTVEFTIANQERFSGQSTPQNLTLAKRPPRIACLVALAHRLKSLVETGAAKDYAEVARLGHVSRARVTQIVNLLNLAPEIQEYLLWLPSGTPRVVTERDLRRIACELLWDRQRALFLQYAPNLQDRKAASSLAPKATPVENP